MKKILVLIICLIVAFPNTILAATYDEAEAAEKLLIDFFYTNKETLRPYLAYNKTIDEAFLADIDYDGIPELLVSGNVYGHGFHAYEVKNGKVGDYPVSLFFGSGTGIHEEHNFILDDDGHMYVYRKAARAMYSGSDLIGATTIQCIYDWAEDGLVPLKYLKTVNYDIDKPSYYITDVNAESVYDNLSHPEIQKTTVSVPEAEAKYNEFFNSVAPYLVWDQEKSVRNSGLTRIWNIQKERYAKNPPKTADKLISLQIDNPMMNVNGIAKEIDSGVGTSPIVKGGRTLVPVRAIVEEMGGTVSWDSASNTATLSYVGKTIKLTANSKTAYLDNKAHNLDVPPEIINGRTMLPIRFIAESFGFDVNWKGLTQQIIIADGINQEPFALKNNAINNVSINHDLISCIGKSKEEIIQRYGQIVDSEYYMGGKYYIHNDLKTQIFYENPDDEYDSSVHDDVEPNAKCLFMYIRLSELLGTPNKSKYNVEELQSIFGDYEFFDALDNEFYPACTYKFYYEGHLINVVSGSKNPIFEYAYFQ